MTDNTFAVGLDIGKTQIKAGVVDADGSVHRRKVRDTDLNGGANAILSQCQDIVDTVVANTNDDLQGIGIGATGEIDSTAGTIISEGTIDGWENIPIADQYEDRYDLPVAVENDVFAAALGENHFGSVGGTEVVVYVIIGTGIAATPIINGEPWKGAHGIAGQIAHLPLFDETDTVNDAFGGRQLGLQYARATGEDVDTVDLFADAAAGERVAKEIKTGATEAAADVFAWLQSTVDPEMFVLGGGVAEGQPDWIAEIEDVANERLSNYAAALDTSPNLRLSELGADSGIIGAASLHLD
jgi:glucokinase